LNLLFVCSRNRLRSPTAEAVFATEPGVEAASAGLNHDADTPLTPDLVDWADIVFVMERSHRRKLSQRFGRHLGGRRVVCLDIPDRYEFMDLELVRLIEARVRPHLRR
jgi:predicted protein tyrosine phosphatase